MSDINMETRNIPKGTLIFSEGDPGREMFIVEQGKVRIWRKVDGKESVLGFVEKGGCFGETALINDLPRMASASAENDCVLAVVSKADFSQRLGEVNAFVRAMIKLLAMNINSLTHYMDEHGIK